MNNQCPIKKECPLKENKDDLNVFNNILNNISEKNFQKNKLENTTLKTFINNMLSTIYNIINEIISINLYEEENDIFNRIFKIFVDILKILTNEERIFYTGIILIIFSLFLYLIEITN